MSDLGAELAGISHLGLDSAPIIYFVERHPDYFSLVHEVFARIADGSVSGCSSVLTLAEVLIHPIRVGDHRVERAYRLLLLESQNIALVNTDPLIADLAAQLRVRYELRTPDAIQLATALHEGCDAFLTNDQRLRRVTEMRVIILREWVS